MLTWRRVGLGLVVVLALLLMVGDWTLLALTAGSIRSYPFLFGSAFGDAVAAFCYAVAVAVGLLIVTRRPGNRIGWLLVGAGLATLFGGFASEYAGYGIVADPGSLPRAQTIGWLGAWMWRVGVALIVGGVLLRFPDGRLPSSRWRPAAAVSELVLGIYVASHALAPGPMAREFVIVHNPFGMQLPGLASAPRNGWFLVLTAVAISVTALSVRASRGPSVERQQIKWLGYAAGLALAGLPLWQSGLISWQVEAWWADAARLWTLLVIPVAIGLAILRHHLYNIDLVIRRTVAYTLVTVLLAGAYAVLVVVLQRPLAPLTDGSEVVVATSTLLVAAAFGPLRRRVQGVVDRRFNRERYDAVRTVERFGQRLRDELELATMTDELREVVAATIHPASVSLWMAGPRLTPPPTPRRSRPQPTRG